MSQGAANFKVELVAIDHLESVIVRHFPDKTNLKFSTWDEVLERRIDLDADDTDAKPCPSGEAADTGPTVIIRNAEELSLNRRDKNILKVADKGIVAVFSIVVKPVESKLKELAQCKEPLKVMIIQEMLDLYLARYYKPISSDDAGFSVRTTVPKNVVDSDKDHSSKETPAYCTKYCYKTCDVSELKKNMELQMNVFFFDSPIDSAYLSRTWDSDVISAANKALGKHIPYKKNDETSLDYMEKFAPYRTWLVIYDPNCDFYYPEFCFEWVSQYRVDVGEKGELDASPLCPKERIPFLGKVNESFHKGPGDPRTKCPAWVHSRADLESSSLDKGIEMWKTLLGHTTANENQQTLLYYGETMVMKDLRGKGPSVASDAIEDEEERAGLKVVWKVKKMTDDGECA